MGALKDAINAKATPHQRAAMAAEDWCKANGWTRICDIPSDQYADTVTHTWETLPNEERLRWIDVYKRIEDAKAAWDYSGRGAAYKVPVGFVMDDGEFLSRQQFHQTNLTFRGFMMVFDLRKGGE
jgi:hypothetical protein